MVTIGAVVSMGIPARRAKFLLSEAKVSIMVKPLCHILRLLKLKKGRFSDETFRN